jgi:hypothetical protein
LITPARPQARSAGPTERGNAIPPEPTASRDDRRRMVAVSLARRRFTADEYDRMAKVGILTEDDRVELIEGEIVQMTPIGRRHAGAVNRIGDHFARRFAAEALVAVQNPVRLDEHSEPQQDVDLDQDLITVYRDPSPSGYGSAIPVRRDAQLAPLTFPDRPIPAVDILGE